MDFLKHVRKKLHKSAIVSFVTSVMLTIALIGLCMIFIALDSPMVAFPAVLALSPLMIIYCFISYFTAYPSFVKRLKRIGDINVLSETLANTQPSEHTLQGELRYNNHVVFYMSDSDDITLIDPKRISAIQAISITNKHNQLESYVSICYNNTALHIQTKDNQNDSLCQDMIEKCHVRTNPV